MLRRQHSPLWRLILALEIIADVFHLHPLDTRLATDVLDQSLQHENHVWVAADVRMDRHGEAEVVIFPIEKIEMVSP